MSDGSNIEWTDATWNPVRGCSRVSEGCRHCYAEGVAARFSGEGMPYEGLASFTPGGPRWTGRIRLVHELLDEPIRWRKPRRVFVNSMSDLFHPDVPDQFIERVWAVMLICALRERGAHTFQVLTKRPERMRRFFEPSDERLVRVARAAGSMMEDGDSWHDEILFTNASLTHPRIWLGVSVENQAAADERIPHLVETPAALRFLSCEPLLGPIDLRWHLWQPTGRFRTHGGKRQIETKAGAIGWVIAGGESGHGARELDVAWIRSLVQQGHAAGAAVFVKQLGASWARSSEHYPLGDAKGGDPAEWPEDLRVRQMPASAGSPT